MTRLITAAGTSWTYRRPCNRAQDAARENGVSEDNLPYDTNVKKAQEALDEYDTQRAEEIRSAIIQAWKQDAQAIVDYCLANYSTSIEMKTGYTRDEVLQDAGLQVMFAMVDTGYGTLGTDGTLTGTVTGAVWDMKNQFPTRGGVLRGDERGL